MATKIVGVGLDWAFEQSDHASISIDLCIRDDVKPGPGLTKVNARILDDSVSLHKVKNELLEMLAQAPNKWNALERLEYKLRCYTSCYAAAGKVL